MQKTIIKTLKTSNKVQNKLAEKIAEKIAEKNIKIGQRTLMKELSDLSQNREFFNIAPLVTLCLQS